MTRYPPTYTSYISNLVTILKQYFNLQDYALTTQFHHKNESYGCRDLLAAILVDPRYFQIKLQVYPLVYEYWKNKDYERVARVLTHEFCHTLFQGIWDRFTPHVSEAQEVEVENLFEQQVQRTANIIFQSLPTAYYLPQPKPTKPLNAKSRNKRPRPSTHK
jgi:hypothetical protein